MDSRKDEDGAEGATAPEHRPQGEREGERPTGADKVKADGREWWRP